MVVVQVVRIVWTKASRGAPHASRRNALPRAFGVDPSRALYVFERHFIVETAPGEFRNRSVERRTTNRVPSQQEELVLEEHGARLVLGLQWQSYRDDSDNLTGTGEPPREGNHRAVEIGIGQTARLVINGRHSSHAEQWYTEDIFNVALVDKVEPDVFTGRPCQVSFSQLADLF